MGILDETRFIEQIRFFDGQRLFADDLQGLEAFNREMRWLHNKSLHQPGIGIGYAVSGPKGESEVKVGPGYALDADGREIISTQTQTLQVPPVASDEKGRSVFYDLTVSYQETDLEEVERREGLCDTSGTVRLREAPVFCWVRLNSDSAGNLTPEGRFIKDIQDGKKIILTRVEVLNCKLQQVISINQRPSARPECGPRIVCETVDPTPWKEVDISAAGNIFGGFSFALEADIDTSAANFLVTPCYSANIPGPRLATITVNSEDETVLLIDIFRLLSPKPRGFQVFLFVFVVRPSSIVFNEGAAVGEGDEDTFKQDVIDWIHANWNVSWMGVEG